jgi:hypothetical protein
MTFRTIRLTINDRRCIKSAIKSNDPNYETTPELDSHANTCMLGRHALIVLQTTIDQRPAWDMMNPLAPILTRP